jgi:glycerol-3-phosphate acyltransferase PlsY
MLREQRGYASLLAIQPTLMMAKTWVTMRMSSRMSSLGTMMSLKAVLLVLMVQTLHVLPAGSSELVSFWLEELMLFVIGFANSYA